jgi:hypothetical protein
LLSVILNSDFCILTALFGALRQVENGLLNMFFYVNDLHIFFNKLTLKIQNKEEYYVKIP